MAITVGTGGFERRFSYTLPAFTGTHDAVLTFRQWDFPAAALDGGSDSFLNGGGDFRACLNDDGTNELPTHVVRFVTGVSPDVEVKVYVSGATSGQTLYFFGKKAGAVAYGVAEPFGRNATWQDYKAAILCNDLSFTDVTGNGHDGVATGVVSIVDNAAFFGIDSKSYVTLSNSTGLIANSEATIQATIKPTTNTNFGGIFGNWQSSSSEYIELVQRPSEGLRLYHRAVGTTREYTYGSTLTVDQEYYVSLGFDGINSAGFVNGIQIGVDSASSFSSNSVPVVIGSYYSYNDSFWDFQGSIKDALIPDTKLSPDRIALEYSNQSNTGSSWGTVGALEDTTSGGDNLLSDDLQSLSNLSSPAIGQTHSLTASSLQSLSTISTPALSSGGGEDNLLANDLRSLSAISTPSAGQAHALQASSLQSLSAISTPALSEIHNLINASLQSLSTLTKPAIQQAHNLLASRLQSLAQLNTPLVNRPQSEFLIFGAYGAINDQGSGSVGRIREAGIGVKGVLHSDNFGAYGMISGESCGTRGRIREAGIGTRGDLPCH